MAFNPDMEAVMRAIERHERARKPKCDCPGCAPRLNHIDPREPVHRALDVSDITVPISPRMGSAQHTGGAP